MTKKNSDENKTGVKKSEEKNFDFDFDFKNLNLENKDYIKLNFEF